MEISVRRAEEKDIDRIVALLKVIAYEHHKGRPDLFREGRKKYSAHEVRDILYEEDRAVFVAVDENDYVLGYLFSYIIDQRTASLFRNFKTLYIDDLCIDENFRNTGIGNKLFAHSVEFARECGCYNIELNVWSFNDRAIEFYKKQGMEIQCYKMEYRL